MSSNNNTMNGSPDRMLAVNVDDRAPAPANVPDLMRVGPINGNPNMDVETDILDPVVFSQDFCRFRLQNKGILHSNSKITLALTGVSASGNRIHPIGVGVHALVQRAVLKIGGKTICETDDFNHYMGYKSKFIPPEHNKEREIVTSSRMMARKWDYTGTTTADKDTNSINDNAQRYTLDIGRQSQAYGNATANQVLNPFSWQILSNAPVFQITINDLFPFLKMNQLPLYMMREEISIELHFAPHDERVVEAGDVGTSSTTYNIDESQTKFIADYIYYPQEIMSQYAMANQNMSFTYVDHRVAKRTHAVTGGVDTNLKNLILNVGGAGRIVTKVFSSLSNAASLKTELQNKFISYGTESTATGDANALQGSNVHNVRYNDLFLYPIDISNNNRLLDNLQQTEANQAYIHTEEYSTQFNKDAATGSDLIAQTNMLTARKINQSLTAKSMYMADRLNRNERVNERGIEVYDSYTGIAGLHGNLNYVQRVWLETLRFAALRGGYISVTYA